MRIGEGSHTYNWIENWASIPDTHSGRINGRTHGVVVSETGRVLIFHQANPAVLVFDLDGKLLDAWGDRFLGAHGMTLVKENGIEYLWLTDQDSTEVVKTTVDGKTVMSLGRPYHAKYLEGKYSPTWVAVNEERFGGNRDIWVADGYGMNIVHRFNKSGEYLQSIDGTEGSDGAFNCPHGISFNYRSGASELYIADRGNKRFQIYSAKGEYLRSFGSDVMTCPCTAITVKDELIIPELSAKLTVLNRNNDLVCYLGDNEQTCNIQGWPNHPKDRIQPGKFNSPHSIAADSSGNLYIVEWIIGGRITKLELITS